MDQWTEEIRRGRAGRPVLRAVSGHAVRLLPRSEAAEDDIRDFRDHPSRPVPALAEDDAPDGIRVLVVGDDVLARRGLLAALDGEPGMTVVGDHRVGPTALVTLGQRRPDVVLLHGPRPEDAAPVLAAIHRAGRTVRVLGIGERDGEELPRGDGVVSGSLPVWATPEEVVAAVRIAAAGFAFGRTDRPAGAAPGRDTALRDGLSERECDVLALVARGMSNAEIADALSLSAHTVKSHMQNLLGKLGLRNRIHAVLYAFESGLVTAGTAER